MAKPMHVTQRLSFDGAVDADEQSAEQPPPDLERRQFEDVADRVCYDPDTRT